MKNELIQLIDKKLTLMLRKTDSKVGSLIRDEWKEFNPSPSCPSVNEVSEKIKRICHEAQIERGEIAKTAVEEVLLQHESLLDQKTSIKIFDVIKKHFPRDTYVELASKTEEVFLRRGNGKNFQAHSKSGNINNSLISCSAANLSRDSTNDIYQLVKDYELRAKSKKGSFSGNTVKFIGKYIILPSVKWIFAILSTVIVAIIVYIVIGDA